MWIKICANTNLEDLGLAIHLGANAVGFVFAPSPRQVTPSQAAALTRQLSPSSLETTERIGVFPAWNAPTILAAIEHANLTGAQLHGPLDLELIRTLNASLGDRISLTQVLHWDLTPGAPPPDDHLRHQLRQLRAEPAITRVLIDSRLGQTTGGTGTPFDWSAARSVLDQELGHLHLIVAGGLNPENVGEAIRLLAPWGVDVASGVEAAPGHKDPKKLEAFLRKASAYQHSSE